MVSKKSLLISSSSAVRGWSATRVRSGFVKMKTIRTVCIDSDRLRSSIRWMSAGHYQTHWRSCAPLRFHPSTTLSGSTWLATSAKERSLSHNMQRVQRDRNETLLRECIFATGAGMVDYIERSRERDPLTLGSTESSNEVFFQCFLPSLASITLY